MAPERAAVRRSGRTGVALVLLAFVVLAALGRPSLRGGGGVALAEDGDAFERALSTYQAYLKRPSLRMRTRGRRRLAATGDARAASILTKSYKDAVAPPGQEQYLIAGLVAESFGTLEHRDLLKDWRREHAAAKDAWLWFTTLRPAIAEGEQSAVAEFLDVDEPFLLHAGIAACAAERSANSVALAADLLASRPKPETHRALAIESAAKLLAARRSDLGSEEYDRVLEELIATLRDPRTAPRTRLVVARRLGVIFDTEEVVIDPAAWSARLERAAAPPPTRGGHEYADFGGIRANGSRIAYVIDLSDSMAAPLTDAEKERLRRAVTPGGARSRGTGNGATVGIGERDLPWEEIETRFDAAREFVKLSLAGLSSKQRFAVIWFGTKAAPLPSTTALVRATPKAVRRVARELDSIELGPPDAEHESGTLRGWTNLHGGVRRAFMLTESRPVGTHEYVDVKAFTEGVDTIFVLSDGTPSWCDWTTIDKRDPGDRAYERDSSVEVLRPEKYYSVYYREDDLLPDLERLNLFRSVEIHCVGFGESDERLLRRIAAVGGGRVRVFGGR